MPASPVEPLARSAPGLPPGAASDPAPVARLALGLDRPPAPAAGRLADFLAAAFGPATVTIVHYGSHTHAGGGPAGSAWDFFVVVDRYGPAYRALAATLPGRIRPRLGALLNRFLPPNVVAVDAPPDPHGAPRAATAKVCVLTVRDLARAAGPRPRDHFTRARLFQAVQVVWARAGAADVAPRAIAAVRAGTFAWVRPFLPARFDAAAYARTLLEVSYRAEIRPEDDTRVDALLAAQRDVLVPVCESVLAALADRGVLVRDADGYRDPAPPGAAARLLGRAWFAWSKARATLRWAKYVALYRGWLDYVVAKVERGSGQRFELSARERRWPLIFLWPRALRFLGTRPGRRRG